MTGMGPVNYHSLDDWLRLGSRNFNGMYVRRQWSMNPSLAKTSHSRNSYESLCSHKSCCTNNKKGSLPATNIVNKHMESILLAVI